MELAMDCLTSRIPLQKASSYKYQFWTKVCVSSRLVSQVSVMARQNINEKYLICQIPIKILKQYAIPNSSLRNLLIFSSKGYRKTSQKWTIYVANTAILELRFFSETYHFKIMGFWFDWWILLLLTLKSTHYLGYMILRFVLTNHVYALCSKIICIADWLISKKKMLI